MAEAYRTLPLSAADDAVKALVVEWSELPAAGRFADAPAVFPNAGDPSVRTPDLLARTIAGYGVPEPRPGGEVFAVTPLLARPDADDIIRNRVRVGRENLYGPDPARYLGRVRYDDVPLNGERSDLTARFHILRAGADRLTLEFLDIHVM
jgi:hypothetical protein